MCTAISFLAKSHYFGRNLDFEYAFGEQVAITPRNYAFPFLCAVPIQSQYAMIGMAMVDHGYPLYFDATNECGLSMAGLYFPDNAVYRPLISGMDNITPFEFIPWILRQCKNISQAKNLLQRLNLVNIPYSEQQPLSPLHWLISDREHSLVVEPMADNIVIYDNPVGVLTNNPPFDYHMYNLSNYLNVTREEATNRFSENHQITPYCRGMGGIGLPGDLSSASRFVRATFTMVNSVCDQSAESEISQFFHILGSVSQQKGCVRVGEGYEKTIYTSCCDTDSGIYYYTTYNNSQITGIAMQNTDLNGRELSVFPLVTKQQIHMEN